MDAGQNPEAVVVEEREPQPILSIRQKLELVRLTKAQGERRLHSQSRSSHFRTLQSNVPVRQRSSRRSRSRLRTTVARGQHDDAPAQYPAVRPIAETPLLDAVAAHTAGLHAARLTRG